MPGAALRPLPDDGLPAYLQGYTTVNGMRIRATAHCPGRAIQRAQLPCTGQSAFVQLTHLEAV